MQMGQHNQGSQSPALGSNVTAPRRAGEERARDLVHREAVAADEDVGDVAHGLGLARVPHLATLAAKRFADKGTLAPSVLAYPCFTCKCRVVW